MLKKILLCFAFLMTVVGYNAYAESEDEIDMEEEVFVGSVDDIVAEEPEEQTEEDVVKNAEKTSASALE